MTLSKNDYLKNGKDFIRVIGVLDEIVFPSLAFKNYNERYSNNPEIFLREYADKHISVSELKAYGWTKCTAQEAGAPKESWSPKKGEFYIWATFNGDEVLTNKDEFYSFEYELKRIALGNCFKPGQESEAIAWLKSKLDLKV